MRWVLGYLAAWFFHILNWFFEGFMGGVEYAEQKFNEKRNRNN